MTDRDPVVAEALRDLPVPDHRPGFWDELEQQLVLGSPEPQKSGRGDPRTADDLVLHPALTPIGRNAARTNRLRWLAAAALVVVVAAAAVLATRPDGDGGRTITANQPPDGSTATSAATATTSTATTTPPAAPPTATPDAVVADWLDALGDGRIDDAAALTGPRSRERLPTLEGMLQESSEGYGAWAASPDRSFTEVDLTDDLTVVVVSGTWTGEGETENRTDAFPVARTDDGRWMIEPWAYDIYERPLYFVHPAPGTGLAADAAIEVAARGDGRYLFSLDDGEVVDNGPSPVWNPPGDMTSQTHLLVAAYLDGDTIAAAATTFLVEG